MSRHFSFDCHEDYTEAAHIEALLLLRGGRILDAASGVALALLDERPVVVRLEGRRSGNYALLSKTGPGTIKQLSDQQFLEWAEADGGAASARPDQQVVDLAEGEARLCEVMQAIQDEVVPQVSALIAARAQELNATEEGRETKPEPPSRSACFEALAAFFAMGGYSGSFPAMAGIVQGLLKDVPGITLDLLPAVTGSADSATAHLALATPGTGKTRSVVGLIDALPTEAVVAVFQPTLKKADEFARDMAASSRPVHVFRGRGAPVQEGASERMCRRHAAAAELAGKGYPVKSILCGSSEPGAVAICPHAAGCAYLAQMKTLKDHVGGGVFILTHASLTQLPAFPAPHLVIIDEDPSASLPQAITIQVEALGMAADWATLLPDDGDEPKPRKSLQECDCAVSDETDDATPSSVMDLLERLRDGLACPAPLQEIATSIMVEEIEAALKMLRGLERKLRGGLKPGLPEQALREHLAVTALPDLQSLLVVLSAILEEVRLFVSGVIDRSDFNGLSFRRDATGELRSITAHRLARPAIKADVPMIVLDGTADPVLVGRALRRRMVVSKIDLRRQGEVVQCIGRGFGTGSLVPIPGYQVSAKIAAEREQLWQGLDTVLRREVAAAPAGVLVVSTLAVDEEARRRGCCDDLLGMPLAWTHFGAVRGINAFTNRQTIILIGRKQPPASAVEAIARAYFALDARPFDLGDGSYDVRRRALQDKMGRAHSVTTQVHLDSRINRILWQVREAEVIQALDRVRAVRFPRRVLLLNALDLRRLDDDPATEELGVPADRCMSWPEIRNGGNRAEAVLEASGGFLPVAPKALVQIAPEIFPSLEAAKKWLQRTDISEALVHHAEHLTYLQVRPIGQRGKPWPLIVDRRRQKNLSAARADFEAMIGMEMAVWQVDDGSRL
ncbi:hypothetical protein GCM10011452_30390 [Gemmobacter lanyuensis]|uniref:Uncharacterized protein n=1 Tax=Gemmobacter lanyuensis TaxID=1054497 RepID=A0A918J1L8_9RHOB|nr:hypothetical protein [Gemmobacter lanyuensis]GGW39912.1 hypothetical protein GCM10011452_30390 [Gemmobacter lanyuensis]